jgi:hypothetical protein
MSKRTVSNANPRNASFHQKGYKDGLRGRADVALDGVVRHAKTIHEDQAYREGYEKGERERDTSPLSEYDSNSASSESTGSGCPELLEAMSWTDKDGPGINPDGSKSGR